MKYEDSMVKIADDMIQEQREDNRIWYTEKKVRCIVYFNSLSAEVSETCRREKFSFRYELNSDDYRQT